ncbi:hypothetical protein [Aeribacillus sp. FSL M8-0254]|uniref:hypothetical protein n=1 Tax=Aeribacillus sp. FSL M8-0254 TaxID=2954577 RepID=UPI0030F9D14E
MNKFEIVNLEGLGIKAMVINDDKAYLTYKDFAVAAGHPDAAVNSIFGDSVEEKRRRVRETFGEIVDVLAKGNHEHTGELIYVIKAKTGEKFLIGERGLKITNFPDIEYDDLIKNIERLIHALRLRAYREGYKQGRLDEKIKGSGSEQYQQQRRDEIVERAKRDIDELKDDGLYKVPFKGTFNYACFADFIVNREKRTVVALLRGYQSGKVLARGIANCHPNDCFNVHIGKAIALRRALNIEVPDEYLNAPQPTEVRVGDVVRGCQFDGFYIESKTFTLIDFDKEIGAYRYAEDEDDWIEPGQIGAIIDDSREEVAE